MDPAPTDRFWRWTERGLAMLGLACLAWAGTVSLTAVTYQTRALAELERRSTFERPDVERVLGARSPASSGPIGRLEIPSLGLSAVVAEGDDDATLKLAIGHLPDTPLPWEEGNTALAGHRDTFFRPLRRIQDGAEIRLVTPRATFRYRVTGRIVVDPDELWVLDPSPAAALTLITCYPFDFVGAAPRRFIVHAERISEAS
jgi:sortase A